ncbi:zinc finger CCCH domain-containing protein 3 isoform X2 [Cyprinodon tularosa]|uniref:zinc finger CCCH domain-containing protein 3 isoform X2 n=1 Tax=Cyprinodon tularosa TaxID=77115 RepID=UPI0018E23423|nr:zinc finger CCCH domain-containing protein 3 isoform X2 [Cyprinodon tularosa]
MEEREALKRQIELLQDLINKHKSVHGDEPITAAQQRQPEVSTAAIGRSFSTSVFQPHSSSGKPYAPQSRGSWKKTYSLRNNAPQSSGPPPSGAPSNPLHPSASKYGAGSIPATTCSRENQTNLTKTVTSLSGNLTQKKEGIAGRLMGVSGTATAPSNTSSEKQGSSSGGASIHQNAPKTQEGHQKAENRLVILPGKKTSASFNVSSVAKTNTLISSQKRIQVQNKPSLSNKASLETYRTKNFQGIPTQSSDPTRPALLSPSKESKLSSQTPQGQVNAPSVQKSKFTWVKSQTVELEPKAVSSVSIPIKKVTTSQASALKASVGSPLSGALNKKTPKKFPRKLSPVTIAPKTSKYRWVSSSGVQPKTQRKPLSPKALTVPQKVLERRDAAKKLKSASTPPARLKKGITASSASSAVVSRYRWKAEGLTAGSLTGTAAAGSHRSAFHWTAEKSNKGLKVGHVSPTLSQRAYLRSSPGGFKLRSRMKIIRKSPCSVGSSERVSSLASGKLSPRSRLHTITRSPAGLRRTPSRELVCFGRHKLRRLSPTSSKNTVSTSHLSPASKRVFRTRYKIVTRPGTSGVQTPQYNPALTWRARKIQSARTFLQNRLRGPHDRHQASGRRWTGPEMCWIRGSLYRVSANKLSRTVAPHTSIDRRGKSSSPHTSPALTRHLASRAVQRSIAIIRHARQKKDQKQFCMYYNRFGKCNRGTSCPFIHDPDKVAVCTRFLRGTCKQADGTCPFSHKVAKEKMPVCSYFLKGICNNSDCPYSHVYVSRKAEVCEDFVKGYCPEGEKCKKKHTLVCPDFSKNGSCPRGSRCKLQHRQRLKRNAGSTSATPSKKVRSKEPMQRPHLSVVMPQDVQAAPGTPIAGPLALPSFISLSSSPEEADAPHSPLNNATQVKERKLQIKPRLGDQKD